MFKRIALLYDSELRIWGCKLLRMKKVGGFGSSENKVKSKGKFVAVL
jgi:hypothetical protein